MGRLIRRVTAAWYVYMLNAVSISPPMTRYDEFDVVYLVY